MRSETPKAQAVRYWWTKATQSLSAARRELAAGDYALAVNRAYYEGLKHCNESMEQGAQL